MVSGQLVLGMVRLFWSAVAMDAAACKCANRRRCAMGMSTGVVMARAQWLGDSDLV